MILFSHQMFQQAMSDYVIEGKKIQFHEMSKILTEINYVKKKSFGKLNFLSEYLINQRLGHLDHLHKDVLNYTSSTKFLPKTTIAL